MGRQPASRPSAASGRWAVGLVGGSWELNEIAPHFAGSIRIESCDDGWELAADHFQVLNEVGGLRTLAGEMLGLINGVARLRLDGPEPISIGNVRRYHENGTKDVFVFPEPIRLRLRMGTPTVAVNGVIASPASWALDVELAARDDRVRAVFAFLALAPTWHSLYAALDTVAADARTGGRKGMTSRSGVTNAQLRLFAGTANSFSLVGVQARHGPARSAPKASMTLPNAEDLVRRVVEGWLDELRRLNV